MYSDIIMKSLIHPSFITAYPVPGSSEPGAYCRKHRVQVGGQPGLNAVHDRTPAMHNLE